MATMDLSDEQAAAWFDIADVNRARAGSTDKLTT
jgi:hypothetical protein